MLLLTSDFDPDDGLPIDEVGSWALEKHDRLRKYIAISRGARQKFLPPIGQGGATYIDLYCGYGRSIIRDTNNLIDGSPVAAFKAARDAKSEFLEIHIADSSEDRVAAARDRITKLGGDPFTYLGDAGDTVNKVASALNPHGLHFAFLDPYSLQALPFSVIETLAKFKRMDILIHVSAQDLQRNLDRYIAPGDQSLEGFMPGWRDAVQLDQSQTAIRARLFDFWLDKIRRLGMMPARGIQLISGERNQRLYWLVFISKSEFANRLWNEIGTDPKQKTLV